MTFLRPEIPSTTACPTLVTDVERPAGRGSVMAVPAICLLAPDKLIFTVHSDAAPAA
jgi:hypothetical protein